MVRMRKLTVAQRIAKHAVAVPFSGCWLWTGSVDGDGYPRMRGGLAHRASFSEKNGEIPPGLEIDHKCEVRCCVNPEHLQAVTHAENNRLSALRGRKKPAHCRKGHPFSGENLYLNPTNGKQVCKTCRRAYRRRVGPR